MYNFIPSFPTKGQPGYDLLPLMGDENLRIDVAPLLILLAFF